jgi:hypothetical protein
LSGNGFAVRLPMDRAEAHAKISEVEERRALFEHTIDGWSVWPLLRKSVADRLSPVFAPTVSSPTVRTRVWPLALRDFVGILRLRRSSVLIKTYSSGLLDKTGSGQLRDIWFDDIIEVHGDAIKIEGVNNRAFIPLRAKALFPSAITSAPADLLISRAAARMTRSAEVDARAAALSEVISNEFGCGPSRREIRAVLASFSWQRWFYSRVLERVRPRVVLTADFGEYALIAAARKRSIPVLEIQHGIADRYHPAYAWSDDASRYRRQLPVPDRMLVFGDHWKNELSVSGFWKGAIDAVGSARVDRYRRVARSSARDTLRLLVAVDGIEAAGTIRFVRELVSAAGPTPIEVVIKLHPVYGAFDQEFRDAFAGEPRVSVRGASDGESTFALLRAVDLHASIASASHYDAIGLGTPTAILEIHGWKAVAPLRDAGHARLVSNGAQLFDALKRARMSSVPEEVSELYFRSGARDNVANILAQYD